MKKSKKNAFTLVEILVVCAVVSVFLASAITLFSNFRQGFTRSESSAILLQDAALFLAQLRNDLNNAVLDTSLTNSEIEQQFSVTPKQLNFKAYDNREGAVLPVIYRLSGKEGNASLWRKIGNRAEKELIKSNVASLTWQTEIESFSGKASGTVRLCLNINCILQTQRAQEKPFEIRTRIFPARLNRQLNNK